MIISISITLLLALLVQSCTPESKTATENAAALLQYERLLDDCKKKGREARSYDVYEKCADGVDADLCKHNRALCKDGAK